MKQPLVPTLSSYLDSIGMRTEASPFTSAKQNSIDIKPKSIKYRDSDGVLHREEGPALTRPDGSKEWWIHGKKHRVGGPAVENANGTKEWFINGKNHRIDGPAVLMASGDELWYFEGKLHREDGPAVKLVDGSTKWYRMGNLHRENGPAVEKKSSVNGAIIRLWYWEGKGASEREVKWRVRARQLELYPPRTGIELEHLYTVNGILHNTNGPARIWYDGTQEWFQNGQRHRLDGPAVMLPSGEEYYYLLGHLYSKDDFTLKIKSNETKNVEHINTSSMVPLRENPPVTLMPTSTAMVVASKEELNDGLKVDSKIEESADDKEKNKNKVKQWPDEPDEIVLYKDIYAPFKEILEKGYRLIRTNSEWKFDYNGYEIGKQEKKIFPNVKEHFTEKFLRREKDKHDQSLMDVVMRLMFLMGIEQGRRMAYSEQAPVRNLEKTLANYRERNKSVRYQLAKANAIIKIREENPTLPSKDVDALIRIELEKTRHIRIDEIKKEIRMDPTLSCFKNKVRKKAKLTDLLALANTLDPEIFKHEDWLLLLNEANCSVSEWKVFCKKHKFNKFIG